MGTLPLSKRALDCVLVFSFCLQRTTALVSCYLFANNCCRCLPLYVRKGLRPLFSVICSQRTAVYHCYLQRIHVLVPTFCLEKTMVLLFSYKIAKNYGPCLLLFIHERLKSLSTAFLGLQFLFRVLFAKDCCPCFPLLLQRTAVSLFTFVCKGMPSLFSFIRLEGVPSLFLLFVPIFPI